MRYTFNEARSKVIVKNGRVTVIQKRIIWKTVPIDVVRIEKVGETFIVTIDNPETGTHIERGKSLSGMLGRLNEKESSKYIESFSMDKVVPYRLKEMFPGYKVVTPFREILEPIVVESRLLPTVMNSKNEPLDVIDAVEDKRIPAYKRLVPRSVNRNMAICLLIEILNEMSEEQPKEAIIKSLLDCFKEILNRHPIGQERRD